MKRGAGSPAIRIFSDSRGPAREAGERLARLLRRRRETVLVLAVGKTMVPVYRELVRLHLEGDAPVHRLRTFNLDELRVAPEDPRSFRSFMDHHLFSRAPIAPESIGFLRGDAADPKKECVRYERELARYTVDAVIAGIGVNGHVAYLEPGRSLPPRTALVRLSAVTRRELAADGVRPVPREAFTIGIETIFSAREILLVATGSRKAPAVAAALEGPVTAACPASFLSLHSRLEVYLDRAAAARLTSARARR